MGIRALSLVLASVLAGVLATPLAADVLLVGAGQPFAEIQAAVDASLDGDVVLVEDGVYPGFEVAGRTVTILARNPAPAVRVDGDVTVRDLVATDLVVVKSLSVRGTLSASRSRGSLRIEDCLLKGVFEPPAPNPGSAVSIEACSDVAITGCELRVDSFGGFSFPQTIAEAALHARDSSVALYTTLVHGSDEFQDSSGVPLEGGPGVVLEDAFLFASGCQLEGGKGGTAQCTPFDFEPGGDGGPAVVLNGATTELVRLGTVLVAGPGGDPYGVQFVCSSPGGADGPKTVLGGGKLTSLLDTSRELGMPPHWSVGDLVASEGRGVDSDLLGLIHGPRPTHAFDATVHGTLLVDVGPGVHFYPVGALPASGVLPFDFVQVELGPGVQGITTLIQPLFLSASGELYVGSPVSTVLLAPGL